MAGTSVKGHPGRKERGRNYPTILCLVTNPHVLAVVIRPRPARADAVAPPAAVPEMTAMSADKVAMPKVPAMATEMTAMTAEMTATEMAAAKMATEMTAAMAATMATTTMTAASGGCAGRKRQAAAKRENCRQCKD